MNAESKKRVKEAIAVLRTEAEKNKGGSLLLAFDYGSKTDFSITGNLKDLTATMGQWIDSDETMNLIINIGRILVGMNNNSLTDEEAMLGTMKAHAEYETRSQVKSKGDA